MYASSQNLFRACNRTDSKILNNLLHLHETIIRKGHKVTNQRDQTEQAAYSRERKHKEKQEFPLLERILRGFLELRLNPSVQYEDRSPGGVVLQETHEQ